MEVIFYSTHCPKCHVLERKLQKQGIQYIEINDVDQMLALGLKNAPILKVDGEIKDFKASVDWINSLEERNGSN